LGVIVLGSPTFVQGEFQMRTAHELKNHPPPSLAAAPEAGSAAFRRENEQLRSIADELGHRMKNLAAIIQAIARQTMRQTTTKDEFEARFSDRLGAFSRSLDLLIANDWHGARIDDLMRSELTTFGLTDEVQISVKGPPLDLNPDAARNIGLALHELATNASKYGALSVPEGKVSVHWELTDSGGQRRFLMSWRESGGPKVTEPTRWGFGRQVVQRLTAQALAGEVTHEFLPDGVRWTLDVPATFVVNARSESPALAGGARNQAK
jgi:two-component sensor histidine kinase